MENPSVTKDLFDFVDGKFFGKYRGQVTQNDDPANRGRLQVIVPAVMGKVPIWALPCLPYGGPNMGLYTIPEVGAGVWVEFEAGHPSHPIWVGCYWGDNQLPEDNGGSRASPPVKILRTKEGLMLSLDDSEEVVTLSDEDGSNLVTIEVRQGKVTIKGTVKVVVDAPQIELVENAQHPLVFGDQLLTYLNQIVALYATHTHTPATGFLPAPPLPPATPNLISFQVRTG
jgi:uncharacterized protein involved in type VI secretion and phage assembly